ncbi:metalloregulator ArsR/SmtB family transcription factor [Sinomonas halotolerans]|uniref:Metalloregulator ArsR/SmtB family transcription factor n=1 Tax=Sinomonas halotolerans TaxID=1644133 RepID=A0ABU9X1I8_9MICC
MGTDIFAVIADRTRRDILDTLRTGDKAVGELVDALEASQPTVSKHLRVLRDAGLVTTRAQGQKRYYALRAEPLAEVGGWLAELRTAPVSPAPAVPEAAAEHAEDAEGAEPAGSAVVPAGAPAVPAPPAAPGAIVPAAVLPGPAGEMGPAEGGRPAQIQRTVERTVERAAARATELMANLPKFGRRR